MPEQASRCRYSSTTASARKVPYQITSSILNDPFRSLDLRWRKGLSKKYDLHTMVGTMLYGYNDRTEVLISTDRCTMAQHWREIEAPWI